MSVAKNILCIDCGKQFIKIGIVSFNSSSPVKVSRKRALCTEDYNRCCGWETFFAEIRYWYGDDVDAVSLAIHGIINYKTGYVDTGGVEKWIKDKNKLGVYSKSLEKIGKTKIFNAAVVFSAYALSYSMPPMPVLAMTLGTGVGLSLIDKAANKMSIKPIEYEDDIEWSNGEISDIHNFVGQEYFEQDCKNELENNSENYAEFTKRVSMVIEELKKKLQFKTVMIGGGHSAGLRADELTTLLKNNTEVRIAPQDANLIGCALAWKHVGYGDIGKPLTLTKQVSKVIKINSAAYAMNVVG